LLKEAHSNLYSLQKLLEAENRGEELLTTLTTQMEKTRLQLKSEVRKQFLKQLQGCVSFAVKVVQETAQTLTEGAFHSR